MIDITISINRWRVEIGRYLSSSVGVGLVLISINRYRAGGNGGYLGTAGVK